MQTTEKNMLFDVTPLSILRRMPLTIDEGGHATHYLNTNFKQAGVELGQAQLKLGLDLILVLN